GLSIPTTAALSYSFIYNATYMIPETIVLVIAALYVGSAIDFRAEMPSRMIRENIPQNVSWISPVSGLLAGAAVIFDVAKIFEKLQDSETGEFTITAISEVKWLEIAIMTGVVAVVVITLLVLRSSLIKKAKA
ncbi:MAG: hypothetical protein ACI4QR_03290, partial [Eubacteriales bacterium]